MSNRITRRDALKTSAVIGASYWLGTGANVINAAAANEKLNIAVIGIGGQGRSNLNSVSNENIVALCDVDDQRAGDAYTRFPKAKKYVDFRRMLDEMDKQIDAVVVSTPDHTHFHPSMLALTMGKHLYCEKPMAHSVWETRQMTKLAAEKKVATQLGVQRHTLPGLREAVQIVWSGAIGDVSEVHSWVSGDRGMPKVPNDTPQVPSHLNWDLWLGPAAERPYHSTYCPYGWRFWWDFGTGETGNWGCHILDIPFWALDLKYPTRVDAEGPPVHEQTTPKQMTTRFEFPATDRRSAVTLHWYHAKNGPPILAEKDLSPKGMNTLFIGSEGMLLCGFGSWKIYPQDKFTGFKAPKLTMPSSPGFHREWTNACKGGEVPTCHFDYTGPMAETVLLGNVAYRAGGGFDWDAENLKASGNDNADRYIQATFREGWEI